MVIPQAGRKETPRNGPFGCAARHLAVKMSSHPELPRLQHHLQKALKRRPERMGWSFFFLVCFLGI